MKLNPKQHRTVSVAPLLPPKTRDLDKPVTRLSVKSRGEYPVATGFPSSLERLTASNIMLTRFDRRLFDLASLRHLDLSNNSIKTIPEEMKDLSLTELLLSGNQIKGLPLSLCYGPIAESLKVLDLSRNCIAYLPQAFYRFKSLIQLKLDCNELQVLPRGFGKLQGSLRFLSISSNKLALLPFSFSKLRLEALDLYGNPFKASGLVRRCSNLSMPGLMELCGRVIKRERYDICDTCTLYSIFTIFCQFMFCRQKCP